MVVAIMSRFVIYVSTRNLGSCVLGSVHTAIRGVEIKCQVGPKRQSLAKAPTIGKSVKLSQSVKLGQSVKDWPKCPRLANIPQIGESATDWQICHKLAEMPGR
jgi:hypothetical protein